MRVTEPTQLRRIRHFGSIEIMKALIKKEALEAIGPVAIVFAALCWWWLGRFTFDEVLIAPVESTLSCVFLVAMLNGSALGYAQFAAERRRGTLDSAIHRAGGHRRLFLAKMVVGLSATFMLALGPVLIFAGHQLQTSPNAPLIQSQRLVEYSLCSLQGTLGWSVGVLASQLRRRWSGLSFLMLGFFGAWILCVASLTIEGAPALSATLGVLLPLAANLGLGWLALRLFAGSRDQEICLPANLHAVTACSGITLFVLPAYALWCFLAIVVASMSITAYPSVVLDEHSRAITLMTHEELERRSAQASRDQSSSGLDHYQLFDPQWLLQPSMARANGVHAKRSPSMFGFVARWDELNAWYMHFRVTGKSVFSATAYLDEDLGRIRLFWIEEEADQEARGFEPRVVSSRDLPSALPSCQVCTKPGGSRFSSSSVIAALGQDLGCVFDPQDRTLWKLNPLDASHLLTAMALPDDDRVVRLEPTTSSSMLRYGPWDVPGWTVLFVGERDRYVWSENVRIGGLFVPFRMNESERFDVVVPLNEVEQFIRVRVVEVDQEPIHPRVEVRDAKDATLLFAHTYAPKSAWQRFCGAGFTAFELLRSPVLCLASFQAEPEINEPKDNATELLSDRDPMFLGHKRPWLLLANLAVTAMCVYSIVSRMRRQGANPLLTCLMALLTVLVGVVAYFYLRALLPARAPVRAPTPSNELRELLIQSA
jgi:hypothetical protein